MALNFPANPTLDQIYTVGNSSWKWNGTSWNAYTAVVTVPISGGGTGETSRQNAIDALVGAVTSGQYLRGNGTDVVMSAIQITDVPTLNQDTTGTAANANTVPFSGVTSKPTTLSGYGITDAYTKTYTDTALALKANASSLATVATSGSYADLLNKPVLFDGVYASLTDKPNLSAYYLANNPSGYTNNTGTVTSVEGTGTVSGLTLTGSVSSAGNLTLGGTLSLTMGNVTTALGYTPYNATNPNGYISGIFYTNVIDALGYTPYNNTNPSGYITTGALSVSTTAASGAGSLSYSSGVFTFTPAATYTLPTATPSVLGGVKIDNSSIVINNGVIGVSSALTSATQFKGNWDASTNTPALSSSSPIGLVAGWQYIVAVGATRDIGNGSTVWSIGDLVIYDGAKWVRIPSGNNVVSFNTRQGAITLTSSDVTTALGFTPYDAALAEPISPTFTYTSGVLTSISYPTGETKTFTYTNGALTRLDYIKGSKTVRKTFNYLNGNLNSITQVTL